MIMSYVRTIALYLVLIVCVRLMGKRQIGEMEPTEFVVTMLLANLAAIPMQDGAIPLYSGLVPILTVLGSELVLSGLILYSVKFRQLLCGKPVILISEGTIDQTNLRRARITLDELTEHLREREVLDLSQVQYAILETNGQISVFPYPQYQPASAKDAGLQATEQCLPVTIVSDGRLLEKNLTVAGRDRAWLGHELRSRNCPLQQTYLLTVDRKGAVYFVRKEEKG